MKKLLVILLLTASFVGCSNAENAISLEEAEKLALKEVNGEIVHSSQETDDGRVYFDVDILKDGTLHELELNAKGKIKSHEQEKNYTGVSGGYNSSSNTTDSSTTDSSSNSSSSNSGASTTADISVEEANNIALERSGGGNVVKNELDYDDGVLRYEIEIINGTMEYDITINAKTGVVISFDQDSI